MRLAIRAVAISMFILLVVGMAASQSYEVRRKLRAGWTQVERVFTPQRR